MTAAMNPGRLAVRTVWLSDLHLGSKDCQADYLQDFLRRVECETLYLLGDIVDLWAMRRRFLWPAAHQEVLRLIMHKARHGTRVVYIPGNHDEAVREFIGQCFAQVEIAGEACHTTADGRRLLLLHGDVLDVERHLGFVSRFAGDAAYDLLMWLHRWANRARKWMKLPYLQLASSIKGRIGYARAAIAVFRRAALAEARRRGFDGVVCGHIHHSEIVEENGLVYCNDGDWIESCTALIEDSCGVLKVLTWPALYSEEWALPVVINEPVRT